MAPAKRRVMRLLVLALTGCTVGGTARVEGSLDLGGPATYRASVEPGVGVTGLADANDVCHTRALIVLWLVTVIAVALALWARSIILGVFCALALPIAVWWTIARWRSWSDTRRTPRA